MADKINFADMLRKSGLKATRARISLLRAISREKRPLSAQGIISRQKGASDPVTVYRNLKGMEASGLLRRVDFKHGHAHYEIADGKDHHHLICIKCGVTEDIDGCHADSMGKYIIKHSRAFAEIRSHALEFFGICRNCSNSAKIAK